MTTGRWVQYYPTSSFNVPVPPPDSDPDEGSQVTVCFAEAWLPYILGSLMQLRLQSTWIGDADTVLLAQTRAALLMDMVAQRQLACGAIVPTPYWDGDSSDADDTLAIAEQPWYGVLLLEETWQAQIEDWVIAALVAYAGGIGAAIAFLTIAPRFRLAFQTHDTGSLVNIFVDSVKVWSGDTSADEISVKYADVYADQVTPGEGPWQIWIEQASSSELRVLRKQLNPGEVYPVNQRYNSGTDTVQYTPDGGTTWQDAPQFDPRHSAGYQKPPNMAGDPKCQAAANMTAFIKSVVDQVVAVVDGAAGATALITLLVGAFVELGPFGILVDLVVGLAAILFEAGASALSAAFTSEVYDQLSCIFYCNIGDDGLVSADQLSSIQTQIDGDIGGLVGDVLDAMLFLMGEVGLSNAGSQGTAAYDCSGCDCSGLCCTFDDAARYTLLNPSGGGLSVGDTTLDTGFGHPAPSAAGGTGADGGTPAIALLLEYNLATTTDITGFTFQYYAHRATPALGIYIDVTYLDSGGGTLYDHAETYGLTSDTWHIHGTYPAQTGVAKIRIQMGMEEAADDLQLWVDNLCITV